jgi:hypothetical protein
VHRSTSRIVFSLHSNLDDSSFTDMPADLVSLIHWHCVSLNIFFFPTLLSCLRLYTPLVMQTTRV